MSNEDIVNEALSGFSGIGLNKARITISLNFEPQSIKIEPKEFEKFTHAMLRASVLLEEQAHRDLPRAEECASMAKCLMYAVNSLHTNFPGKFTSETMFATNFERFREAQKRRADRESGKVS